MRKCRGRIVASILALALALTSGGLSVLAEGENSQQPANVSEEQQEAAGQSETDPEQESQPGEETESTGKQPAEEQTTEGQSDESSSVAVSQWSWIDEDGILQEDNGVWGIGMPGASEENPLTQDALFAMLPSQVQAVTANGETVTLDITWDLSAIPAEGIWSGEQVFTASLPEGYQMADGVSGLSVTVQLGEAETYTTTLPSGSVTDAPFQDHLVNGVSPNGTTINLFDYWLTGRTDSDNEDPWPEDGQIQFPIQQNYGINKDHAFLFGATMAKNDMPYFGKWNAWTGSNEVYAGIVQDKLVDGYPVLNLTQAQVNGARYPYNPQWPTLTGRNPNESLAYLFNSDSFDGKQAYMDVQGLLQVDGNGYYYYDSTSNYAVFYEKDNAFALYDKEGVNAGGNDSTKNGQFFPFNAASDVFNDYYQNNGIKSTNASLNHYFGLSMSTRFIQQNGGRVSEEPGAAPVTYEFSGDDDVWVFIDGTLVADLGGIHNAASLTINFANGEIYVNNELQDKRLGRLLGYGNDTLPDNTYHTLDFFYLERGNTDSNMSLKYNLVTIPESSVIKVDQTGDPVAGAEFVLYAANDKDQEKPIATGTTNNEGEFVFVDADNFPITIAQLYEKYGNVGTENDSDLILRETRVPDGYRSNGDLELRFFKSASGEVLLLSNNQWDVGAYAMSKVTTTAPDTIVEADNGENRVDLRDEENPLMFGVVFQKQENGDWYPVYGDPLNGWHVTDRHEWSDIREAARANPYVFQLASSGAYQINIDNLPGDIQTYYHICGNEDTAKYTIAYYYTTASTINGINGNNTWRIEPESQNEEYQFDRVFSVNLYVPNIKNRLVVQKVDDAETPNPLNGAGFALYEAGHVENVNGVITPKDGEEPYDSLTTTNITGVIQLEGGGVFPTEGKSEGLKRGEYYLFETSAPDGYVKNETAIHIIVDDTGVYADAGTADDGVSVLKGVGSVVHNMVQFAVGDNVDTTLNRIVAGVATATYNGTYAEAGSFTWNASSVEWNGNDVMHLQYANEHGVLDYGLTDSAEQGTVDTLTLETETGWPKLLIRQCPDHTAEGVSGNRTDLKAQDITKIFSGTTVVRVENQRVNSLTISKTVADDSDAVSPEQEFTFTLTMTDASEEQMSQSYAAEGTGAPQNGRVQFDNGAATIILQDGQSITIRNLPSGAKVTVTEADVDGQTYDTTYTVNNGEAQTGKETGNLEIANTGSVNVAFTNTYVPTGDFSFIKTDKGGLGDDGTRLSGAVFAIYQLTCTEPSHEHENSLIEIADAGTGAIASGSTNADCWELIKLATSDSDGQVIFEDLPIDASEYRLVELTAPGGYTLPEGQWRIAYDSTDKAFEPINGGSAVGKPIAIGTSDEGYYIMNYKPGELPFSGNTGIKIFLIIGGILMAAGAVGTVWYLRRKRRLA